MVNNSMLANVQETNVGVSKVQYCYKTAGIQALCVVNGGLCLSYFCYKKNRKINQSTRYVTEACHTMRFD